MAERKREKAEAAGKLGNKLALGTIASSNSGCYEQISYLVK